ncbi:hypothetical protein Pelo_883 [Pelomyxa schiedti]|nr:hypothetical protein Pelo_883 [Pelomyxa schiedti]
MARVSVSVGVLVVVICGGVCLLLSSCTVVGETVPQQRSTDGAPTGLPLPPEEDYTTHTLGPSRPLWGLAVAYGRELLVQVAGTLPDTGYEVKVSYLATSPSSFSFRFVDNSGMDADRHLLEQRSPRDRDLLNVEKVTFRTDSSGAPVTSGGVQFTHVAVLATFAGVVSPPGQPPDYVLCDLALLPLIGHTDVPALVALLWPTCQGTRAMH